MHLATGPKFCAMQLCSQAFPSAKQVDANVANGSNPDGKFGGKAAKGERRRQGSPYRLRSRLTASVRGVKIGKQIAIADLSAFPSTGSVPAASRSAILAPTFRSQARYLAC